MVVSGHGLLLFFKAGLEYIRIQKVEEMCTCLKMGSGRMLCISQGKVAFRWSIKDGCPAVPWSFLIENFS